MATFEERMGRDGKPCVRAKVRLKGHAPVSSTWPNKTAAREWAKKTEADMKAGRHFGASKLHTLKDLLDCYETARLGALKSAKSVKRRLRFWRGLHGDLLLSNLTPDVITKARDKLKSTPKHWGGKARTAADVNRTLAALSSACTFAVKELQWLERNPLLKVSKAGAESRGRIRFLGEDELPRFLKVCRESKNKSLYLAVLLSLTTGGRQSEIMGLRWNQIKWKERTAMLEHTKNGDERALPLSTEVIVLLENRAKVRNLKDDRIFPPTLGDKAKSPFLDLRKPFATALEEAGLGKYEGEGKQRRFIPNFRWHDMRHTAASYLAMSGTSALEIAKVLGHRTMAMVARYSHLSPNRVVQLGDMLASRILVGT